MWSEFVKWIRNLLGWLTIINIIYKYIVQSDRWLSQSQLQKCDIIKCQKFKKMSDEQILPCVMCGQQHEQMLMLVCMHDPCINCAAIHFCSTGASNSHSNVYVCPKCGEVTDLDNSSVVELQRVYAQLKGKKRYDYRRGQGSITELDKATEQSSRTRKVKLQTQPKQHYSPPQNAATYIPISSNNQPYTPISQPSYPANPYNNIVIRKSQEPFYMCQTHPEEQLSYFCFNCNGPICPECAIHGTHRDHEVQTTRKAIKTIKTNLQKCQEGVSQEINSLGGIVEAYKNKLKEMGNQVKKEKDIIRQSFLQLRNILNQKQKQFQRNIDVCYDNNTNIIKNETQSYERMIEQQLACRKNIESTMKKDDLAILQEYSKREKEASTSIETSKNKRFNPDLEGLKEIDYNMFKDEIDQFSGIVSSMKLTSQPRKRN